MDIEQKDKPEDAPPLGGGMAGRFVSALPDLLYLYDSRTGAYLFTNHTLWAQLGHEAGPSPADLLHPDDQASRDAARRELTDVPDGAVVEVRYRLRRGDGAWQWFSSREFVFQRAGDGTPCLIGGVARDWADQQRNLERLHLLESAVVHAQDAIVVTDGGGSEGDAGGEPRIQYVNPAFTAMTGYSPEDVLGRSAAVLLTPRDDPEAAAPLCDYMRQGTSGRVEMPMRRKDGSAFWVEVTIHPATGADGRITHWVGVQRDITERKRTEEALRRSEERWQLALRGSNNGIFDADLATGVVFFSAWCRALHGYAARDVVRPLSGVYDWIHPDDRDAYRRAWDDHLAGATGLLRVEHRTLRRDGSALWVVTRGKCLRSPEGVPVRVTGSVTDITARKALEAERERLLAEALVRAECDPLTGLYNHGAFHRRLAVAEAVARESGDRLAVVVLDIDNFKYFNEAFGHAAGDQVLRQVAGHLLAEADPHRDVVARLGGDEFALLLPGRSRRQVSLFLAVLSARVREMGYAPPGAAPVPLTLTHGWAVFPDDADSGAAVLSRADARLLESKHNGGGDLWSGGVRAELSETVYGFALLDALVAAVDSRDRYTRRHSEDVAFHALIIADALQLDEPTRRTLEIAALIHDVGKIGIPDPILRHPRALTPEEEAVIRLHPIIGESLTSPLLDLPDVRPAIRHHHERWDGGGYPDGLAGQAIPLLARILAVADAYTALTSDRPYRKAHTPADARAVLAAGAGTQWCPECVAAFRVVKQVREDVR